jgi:hypothetical protein
VTAVFVTEACTAVLDSEICTTCVFDMQASFVGAMAIADLVKTTLGPKGMVRGIEAADLTNHLRRLHHLVSKDSSHSNDRPIVSRIEKWCNRLSSCRL